MIWTGGDGAIQDTSLRSPRLNLNVLRMEWPAICPPKIRLNAPFGHLEWNRKLPGKWRPSRDLAKFRLVPFHVISHHQLHRPHDDDGQKYHHRRDGGLSHE